MDDNGLTGFELIVLKGISLGLDHKELAKKTRC